MSAPNTSLSNQEIPHYYRIDPSRSTKMKKTGGPLKSHIVTVTTPDRTISHTMIKKALETASKDFTDKTYLRAVTVKRTSNSSNNLTITFAKTLRDTTSVVCPAVVRSAKNHPIIHELENFTKNKTWRSKFATEVASLHPKGKVAFRLAVALQAIFFPLSGLGYLFFAIGHGIRSKVNKREDTPLSSFLGSLRAINHVSKSLLSPNSSIETELDRAIAIGQAIQDVHSTKKTPLTFLKELEPKLRSSTKENPIALPAGSFDKGTFVPAILLIYKKNLQSNDEYIIEKISLNQEGAPKRVQGSDKYTFKNLAVLSTFISFANQLSNSTNSKTSLDSLLQNYATKSTIPRRDDTAATMTSTNPDPLGLLRACGNTVHELEEKISSLQKSLLDLDRELDRVSESALGIVNLSKQSALDAVAQEIETTERLLLELTEKSPAFASTTGLVHSYLTNISQSITSKLQSLPPAERRAYKENIQTKAPALKKQITKAYGPEIAHAFMKTLMETLEQPDNSPAPLTQPAEQTQAITHLDRTALASTTRNDPLIPAPVITPSPLPLEAAIRQPVQQDSPTEREHDSSPPRQETPPTSIARPSPLEAASATSSEIDPLQLASDLTFIKTQIDRLDNWLLRRGIQLIVDTAGITLDLQATNTAIKAANFSESELKQLLTHKDSVLKQVMDIHHKVKKGTLSITDAKQQGAPIIDKINKSVKSGGFRNYYNELFPPSNR